MSQEPVQQVFVIEERCSDGHSTTTQIMVDWKAKRVWRRLDTVS